WLPPDNFQEHPEPKIAHRTSPTNMGLALLSNLTAYDFGYISSGSFITRCTDALETMHNMDRYQGHFYNWYDTRTLAALNPRYVSTVDSGNLIGHLLTLRQGALGLRNQPIFNQRSFEGLRTTLDIIVEVRGDQPNDKVSKMVAFFDEMSQDASLMSTTQLCLKQLMVICSELTDALTESDLEQSHSRTWIISLSNQLKESYEDFNRQAPWLDLLPVPAAFPELQILENVPTLSSMERVGEECLRIIDVYKNEQVSIENQRWLTNLAAAVRSGVATAIDKINSLDKIADICEELSDVAYEFLF